MEVTIVSSEMIKPSSPSTKNNKPHKLCLFDQLYPLTYISAAGFYPNIVSSDPNSLRALSQTLAHLKKSLSDTLNLYYPLSGRLKNDVYVDDFDSGVPFLVATVGSCMKDYFNLNDAELTNKFVPFPPLRREASGGRTPIPLMGVQASVFSCGGVAIGVSVCHKLADGPSMFYLASSWAAFSRGARDKVIRPSFSSDASVLFPAVNDLPEKYSAHAEHEMFRAGNYVTRKFFFSSKAVEALRKKAWSERVLNPTRNEAVSCFIWKHAMKSASSSSKYQESISQAHHAVNIRGRLKSLNHVGNLCWTATAVALGFNMKLPQLVDQLKGAMEECETALDAMAEQGYTEGSGSEVLLNKFKHSVSRLEQLGAEPFELSFTNWKGFFNGVDFGWGRPFMVGAVGKPGPGFSNFVVLVDSLRDKGIEATIILEEELMAVLERDVNFLAFASPNQGISSL